MTQVQLAKEVSVSQASVSQWESGSTVPPLSTLIRVSSVLGCSLGWLAAGEGEGPAMEAA